MFCWHKWSKWGEIVKNKSGIALQSRCCDKCNKIEIQKVKLIGVEYK